MQSRGETKEGGDWLTAGIAVIHYLASRGHRLRKSISIFSAVASRRANRVFCQCQKALQLKEQIIAMDNPSQQCKSWRQPIGISVGEA